MESLELDSWINDPPSDTFNTENFDLSEIFIKTEKFHNYQRLSCGSITEEPNQNREVWNFEIRNNPHYLKNYDKTTFVHDNYDNIPIERLDIPVSLKITDASATKVKNVRYKKNFTKKKIGKGS